MESNFVRFVLFTLADRPDGMIIVLGVGDQGATGSTGKGILSSEMAITATGKCHFHFFFFDFYLFVIVIGFQCRDYLDGG